MTDSPPFECGPECPAPDHHGRGPRAQGQTTPTAHVEIANDGPGQIYVADPAQPASPGMMRQAATRPFTGPQHQLKLTARGLRLPQRPPCLPPSAGLGRARPTPKRRQPPTQPRITLAWTSRPQRPRNWSRRRSCERPGRHQGTDPRRTHRALRKRAASPQRHGTGRVRPPRRLRRRTRGGGGGMRLSSPFRNGSGTANSGGRFTHIYCAPACGQPPSHPAGRSCHRIRRNDDRQH